MKQEWKSDEIIEHFTLLEGEQELVSSTKAPHNKLGKAILLKFFHYEARFPEDRTEIPLQVIEYLAQQLEVTSEVFESYKWNGRSGMPSIK